MYVSLTPNPVLDINLLIEAFSPGRPQTVLRRALSVGGKGLDASVALRHLGQETVGLHFAAGQTGRDLLALLTGYGIRAEPVWVEGETRTAYIIADQHAGWHTHLLAGNLVLLEGSVAVLLEKLQRLLVGASWLLTGGSLPPGLSNGFFFEAARIAKQVGVRVLIDSWGQPLIECLPAKPDIVKLNQDEFAITFDAHPKNLEEWAIQAQAARERHAIGAMVITCGSAGILAFTPEGNFQAVPPVQRVVNAAGAGDSASAGLVWRLSAGADWPQALTWAAAISAASVRSEGTADLKLKDAEEILPAVVCSRIG